MIRCTASDIYYDGEGGLIYASGWSSISLQQNYLTQITSYLYGAIMFSSSCETTTILRNCMMKTYTTTNTGGQTFYIESQTKEIGVEDNTAVQCGPTADKGFNTAWLATPLTLQIKQNNFSYCRIKQYNVFLIRSSNPIPFSRNTLANDTAGVVYQIDGSQLCTFSYENLVGIDHNQDYNAFGLFFKPTSDSSISNSLFISIDLNSLVSEGSIIIDDCLFFDCSFCANNANTLPFTNTNAHFGSYQCITPDRKTKYFTEQFQINMKAFLTHFIIT